MPLLPRHLAFIAITVLLAFAVLIYEHRDLRTTLHIGLALALGAVLGLLVAWLSRRRFVHEPNQKLIAVANEPHQGSDALRAALANGLGKLGPLERDFAGMAEQLVARQAALRESQATLQSFHESAPTLMGVVELVGEDILHVYDNPATCRFFGRAPGSTEGRLASALGAPSEAIREWATRYREAEARGAPVRFEYRHTPGPEGTYWLMVTVSVIGPGPSGRTRFAYVAEDITERRRTEEALRESEARFRTLLENLPQKIWLTTADGTVEYVNRGWLEYTGMSPADASGWPDLVHPEDRERHVEARHAAIRADQVLELQSRIRRADGSYRWQLIRMVPLKGNDGTTWAWLGSWTDIDDLMRIEQALRESEARFRSLANVVPALVWFATPNGDLHFLNDRWYEYSGQTPEQALPNGWADSLHPEDHDRTFMTWQEARTRGISYEIEFRLRRRDGVYRWFFARAEPLRDEAGRITGWFGTSIDIHDRKMAEAALRESEERLRAALAASRTGTYRWDMRTGAAQGDDAHTTLFGEPIRSDKDFVERIHPEDQPDVVEMLRRCLDEGADFELDYRVLLPDGRVRWLSDRGRVFKDNDGKPLYMTGAVIDITDRKEAEARQTLLAAEVDHRAKNMLALVQVMLRHTRAATVTEYAAAALGRVSALARAHTLLSESRWEGADLRKLVREEIAPFRRTDGTRIQVSGPPFDLSPRAAQSFAMALHELATNATKYGALSQPKGHVSVDWAWRGDGRLALRWTETGGPPVQAPVRRGLGTNVIERSISQQLDGEVRFDWRPEGLVCELIAPASRLTNSAT